VWSEWLFSASAQFFWALVGALLGFGLPYLHGWWSYRRPSLVGSWESTYQGIDEPDGTWIREKINISTSGAELKFKNANSTHGYDYTGFGRVLKGEYIVGNWTSIRSGSNAHGGFILTIASQGDALYGYWVGPDFSGTRRYGRWALGKNPTSLEAAKRELEAARHPRTSLMVDERLFPPNQKKRRPRSVPPPQTNPGTTD
jgi:hypothetical protein